MAYAVRDKATLTPLAIKLADQGLVITSDAYTVGELARINAVMNPHFSRLDDEARAYFRPDDMFKSGILATILSDQMLETVASVIPDPVLYHLHAYEIAGSTDQPHIFADQFGGWHRDPDCAYYPSDPTHISIFVHLSDVESNGGPFQFCIDRPEAINTPEKSTVTLAGPTGMTYLWQRGFFHRASPNRAPLRRRMLKVSVQRNEFQSHHLDAAFFKVAREQFVRKNDLHRVLLGDFQGRAAPLSTTAKAFGVFPLPPIQREKLVFNLPVGAPVGVHQNLTENAAYD